MSEETLLMSITDGLVGGGIVVALLIFLGRRWVGARIDASVQHEYAKLLEAHRLSLSDDQTRESARRSADLDMFNKLITGFEPHLDFLRDQHMRGSFKDNILPEIAYFSNTWRGPTATFHDSEVKLQGAFFVQP